MGGRGGGGGGRWGGCSNNSILSILICIFLQVLLNSFWTGEPLMANQLIRWKYFGSELQVDYLIYIILLFLLVQYFFHVSLEQQCEGSHAYTGNCTVKYVAVVCTDPHVAPFSYSFCLSLYYCFTVMYMYSVIVLQFVCHVLFSLVEWIIIITTSFRRFINWTNLQDYAENDKTTL